MISLKDKFQERYRKGLNFDESFTKITFNENEITPEDYLEWGFEVIIQETLKKFKEKRRA